MLRHEAEQGNIDINSEDFKKHELMYRQGLNFVRNNYTELGEGGAFNSIYKLMMDKDNYDNVKKGYRISAELNALGQGNLSKLTAAEQEGLLDKLQKADLSDDPKARGNIAKDYYMDTTVRKTFNALQRDSKLKDGDTDLTKEAESIVKMMEGKSHTSIEALKKDVLALAKGDKEAEKRYESALGKLTSKVGDVDGTDVLQKIAQLLADIPEALNKFIASLNSGNSPKPGGK